MNRKSFWLRILLTVSLLSFLCVCGALAESNNSALDLVILLDNSGSMYGADGNDYDAYRYDAASIMLNMCETMGSRAVVFEYYGDKSVIAIPSTTRNLVSIDIDKGLGLSDGGNRELISKELTKRAQQAYRMEKDGRTPLGEALSKAVKVLDSAVADRQGRQPVILILADGDDQSAEEIRIGALRECIDKKYKIYTVMLGDDFTNKTTMQDLAVSTGGSYFELSDATELPKYFSQVFAEQTEAELTSEKMVPEQLEDGTWRVLVNIPNRSVQECNIMVPCLGLSNISLSRPDGTEARSSIDSKVYYFEIGGTAKYARDSHPRFLQYKIIKPNAEGTELGKWPLVFRADSEEAAKQVSVTVVYNYDLSLRPVASYTALNGGKNDAITIKAEFATPSGQPADDDMLYRGTAEDSAIACKAYLTTTAENPRLDDERSLTLMPDRIAKEFSGTIKFNDFAGIRHNAGNYYIVLKAEGDGLIRTSAPIPFAVTNTDPETRTMAGKLMAIEDPIKGLNRPAEAAITLSECLTDADGYGDFDLNSIVVASDNKDVVTAELLSDGSGAVDFANMRIKLLTGGTVGTANVTVAIRDIDNKQATAVIPVEVKSLMECMRSDYELSLTETTLGEGETEYQRGTAVRLDAQYRTTVASPVYDITDYSPEIKLQRIYPDGTRVDLEETSDVLDGQGGLYNYEATLFLNGEFLMSTSLELSTGNVAPDVKPDFNWTHSTALIGCEKFPDTLLQHKNTEPWTIAFADMFQDANAADTLTFGYEAAGDAAMIEENMEDGLLVGLTITPLAEGDMVLTLSATDDSAIPQTASKAYSFHVTDQNRVTIRYCIIIVSSLLVLIILLSIIRALVRPRFRDTALQVFLNNVPQKTMPLNKGIKKDTMSKYTLPSHQFTSSMANGLEIRPARDGAFIVVKKVSVLRNAEVKVNGKRLGTKDKKVVIKKNIGELSATVNGEIMSWKLITNHTSSVRTNTTRNTQRNNGSGRATVPPRY